MSKKTCRTLDKCALHGRVEHEKIDGSCVRQGQQGVLFYNNRGLPKALSHLSNFAPAGRLIKRPYPLPY